MKEFREGQQKEYCTYALSKTVTPGLRANVSKLGVGTCEPYTPISGRKSSIAMNKTFNEPAGGGGGNGGIGAGGRIVPPESQSPSWGWIILPSFR